MMFSVEFVIEISLCGCGALMMFSVEFVIEISLCGCGSLMIMVYVDAGE